MTTVAYNWAVLPADTSQLPAVLGINGSLAAAQEAAGTALLRDDAAFAGLVREVRPGLFIPGMLRSWQPTGRWWMGRRTVSGPVHWTEHAGATIPA